MCYVLYQLNVTDHDAMFFTNWFRVPVEDVIYHRIAASNASLWVPQFVYMHARDVEDM